LSGTAERGALGHAGPRHRLADRGGVVAVVLVAPDEGLDELRADDPHGVPEALKLPGPVERARARLQADHAGRQLGDEGAELVAAQPPLEHDPAVPVLPVQLEQVLGHVDAERLDRHRRSPCRMARRYLRP
jgi:hypothetical protein